MDRKAACSTGMSRQKEKEVGVWHNGVGFRVLRKGRATWKCPVRHGVTSLCISPFTSTLQQILVHISKIRIDPPYVCLSGVIFQHYSHHQMFWKIKKSRNLRYVSLLCLRTNIHDAGLSVAESHKSKRKRGMGNSPLLHTCILLPSLRQYLRCFQKPVAAFAMTRICFSRKMESGIRCADLISIQKPPTAKVLHTQQQCLKNQRSILT
jgi:hypothetical protein